MSQSSPPTEEHRPATTSVFEPPGSADKAPLSGFAGKFWRQEQRRRRLKLACLLAGLLFIYWFVPPVWQLTTGPVTVTHWEKIRGETEAVVGPTQSTWIPAKRISRHVLHAFVAAEDGRFYEHHGLDFGEIWDSLKTNWKKKRYARGGSTITQQVVKVAFLDRNKSIIRKAREATGALLLELIMSKEQILEWYINLVEFGDGVYGIKQGCWHYFRTKPELLTIEQAVHLALVLPSPNAWSVGLRRKSLTRFGQRRFASILNRMKGSGYITKSQWAQALVRGDFGRPIHGFAGFLEAQKQNKLICPGSQGCPEEVDDDIFDEDRDALSFPQSRQASGSAGFSEGRLIPADASIMAKPTTAATATDAAAVTLMPQPNNTQAPVADRDKMAAEETLQQTLPTVAPNAIDAELPAKAEPAPATPDAQESAP